MIEDKINKTKANLSTICDENDCQAQIIGEMFTFRVIISPSEEYKAQIKMAVVNDGVIKDWEIEFIFADSLFIKTKDDIEIADEILNKLKSVTKKLHYEMLQLFFKEQSYEIYEINEEKKYES